LVERVVGWDRERGGEGEEGVEEKEVSRNGTSLVCRTEWALESSYFVY
jgi:hypothetical protein